MPPLVLFCGFRDIEDVGSFFRDQALEKGYRLFENSHVYAVREEDGVDIAAKCHSQQGKHVHDVTIRLNPQSRKIIAGSCTCRYGVLGECKHSAAVVHYVNKHEVAACTSLPQAWGKPSKKPKLNDKASIADLFGGNRSNTVRKQQAREMPPSYILCHFPDIETPFTNILRMMDKNQVELECSQIMDDILDLVMDNVQQSEVEELLQNVPIDPSELFFSPERLNREHRDAFELPKEIFRKQYRLPKIVVRWLCDELREEPEVRRVRTSWTVMPVELQVLCALRFYGTGSFQGMVASDEHVARDQKTVSVAVRAVSVAIVRRLGVQRGWIHFPETPSERFDAEKGFRLLGRIPGVIGGVDGTMISIVGPSKNDPTVTKAAYWCRKYFYALNVMVVCDADCRIMCIDPRYPGSVHDSFVWQFSWLRNQLEQGQVPRDGRFLLGDSGYPLEPWLITPVPGNHATSTACGRFNKAHSSISAPQHLPCIERARTGVRLRP
ncbi:putative nuclease HARBI1 isoform X1 [Ixodes scapularis]